MTDERIGRAMKKWVNMSLPPPYFFGAAGAAAGATACACPAATGFTGALGARRANPSTMTRSPARNPCSTTIYTIYKETRSLKWTAVATLMPLAFGAILCGAVAFVWRLAAR